MVSAKMEQEEGPWGQGAAVSYKRRSKKQRSRNQKDNETAEKECPTKSVQHRIATQRGNAATRQGLEIHEVDFNSATATFVVT